jgi:hypothetical protein
MDANYAPGLGGFDNQSSSAGACDGTVGDPQARTVRQLHGAKLAKRGRSLRFSRASSMKRRSSTAFKSHVAAALVTAICLSGCSSRTGYTSAFAGSTALVGNSHRYDANPDQTFKTVKITLVQQGFTIEQADAINGLIKAARAMQDPKDKKISYLVSASVDITGAPSGDATVVTASASQQTVLHKDSEKYFHLLGLVPIPTGKDYQTVVRKEGNITEAGFYKDLFAAIANNIPKRSSVVTFPVPVPAAAAVAAVAAPPVPAPGAAPLPDTGAAPGAAPAPLVAPVAAPAPVDAVPPVVPPSPADVASEGAAPALTLTDDPRPTPAGEVPATSTAPANTPAALPGASPAGTAPN